MGDAKNGKSAVQFRCDICNKFLSSKRSHREHLNVHNQERPFQCEQCDYASASQMTLRRHRLRSHIARTDWGYPCPYCSETYMEPASYQQHVSHRHFGNSCTFGCPHECCNFETKSSKYFLEHVGKHLVIVRPESDKKKPYGDGKTIDVMRFLIDDDIGTGYGKAPLQATIQRCKDVLQYAKGSKDSDIPSSDSAKRKPPPPERAVIPRKSKRRRTINPKETPPMNAEPMDSTSEDSPESNEQVYYDYPNLIPGTEENYEDIQESVEMEPEEAEYYQILTEDGQLMTEDGQLIDESHPAYYEHIEQYQGINEQYDHQPDDQFHPVIHDATLQPLYHNQCVQEMGPFKLEEDCSKLRLPDGQIDIDLD